MTLGKTAVLGASSPWPCKGEDGNRHSECGNFEAENEKNVRNPQRYDTILHKYGEEDAQ